MTISEKEMCWPLSSLKEGREFSHSLTVLETLWQSFGWGLQTVKRKDRDFILTQNVMNTPWPRRQDPGSFRHHVPVWEELH